MLVLAHRGARRRAPENTLDAFAAARAAGADGVELDVHVTRDGVLVVHHDAEVPGLGALASSTSGQIAEAAPSIPTLAGALDACAAMVVNVEIKDGSAGPVVDLLRARSGHDMVVISSFDLGTLDRVHALGPELPTGYLVFGEDPLEALGRAEAHGHAAVHPDVWSLVGTETSGRTAAALVGRAHDAGLAVRTWTVNDADAVRGLAEVGIDAVITDVPDVALRALGRVPAPPA